MSDDRADRGVNIVVSDRLQQQIAFILEIDKLKQIFRQTYLLDATRKENDAEHSWHLAMMAILLPEWANEPDIDVLHVVKMVLIHDLVEIDAGDTYAFDEKRYEDKAMREEKAAERLFHLLPHDQAKEIYDLWREFEDGATPEAQFANSLDRVQPLMHNYYTDGKSWREHRVTSDKVWERIRPAKEGSETLYEFAESIIRGAIAKGYFVP